ncbi:DEAD/DEAH box helicase [Pendulispora albinea]|uniref:DEAD/DEAH box helicase n=1 Tax=Pendulispora albinea TaxID=2741071 RepID=A0ABZ2M8B3_9BACT
MTSPLPLPASFHPAVRAWFERTFDQPTEAQSHGWKNIVAGKDTLIAAPTGSGKTLAAFLASLDALVHRAYEKNEEEQEEGDAVAKTIDVVYISPLKALSSDVQRNLEAPLAGIRAAAAAMGLEPPDVRTALRTGDTTPAARAAIVRNPPHILITTPESLYLMLTAERTRALLANVRTVIVDELHALMRDKRGSHLALSLARLDSIAKERPQRIGLSATVHPIEDAARFLTGPNRTCAIVNQGHRRDLELRIEVPATDLQAVPSHEQWKDIYDRIASLVGEHRTTLVFVNTRRMAERVAHHLGERLGEDRVAAHHGSLSKERRLRTEQRLKAGDMRALVATASLELGIDIGSVDLVCQIGTPRAITTFLQRIGRAGHGLGRISRGRLFATSRDELLECAALVRAVGTGRLDRIEPPEAPLDVLAQHLVAECAAREWDESALYALVRESTPYAELSREAFDGIVEMLSTGVAPRLGRNATLLHRDRVAGVLRGRRASRIIALTNGGAIPDVADYRVILDPDETLVGTVNEDWAIESMAGDVFVLGTHSWRIRRVESRSGVMRVEDAQGLPPSVPFWLGEAPSRTWELSAEVSRLRADLVADLDGAAEREARSKRRVPGWLSAECAVGDEGAAQIVEYVMAQRDALGVVPTMEDIVFERFFDEAGGMQLVVHAPFGGRVNRAFGLALRKRFCQTFDFELQAAATDDAIVLSMGQMHSFPLQDAFRFVRNEQLDGILEQAILVAPMFGARWRWNAGRALAVLRHAHGKKVPPFLQRMRADDLLAAVFPSQVACQENVTGPLEIPDHPLVRQTVHDCLFEAMDTVRLHQLLTKMERGEIRMHARDTTEPSPFTHEVLNAKPYAFLDDAPLEERRARAISLRRTLPEHQRDLAALDPDAIARVIAEARPSPRDPDELHDALLGLVVSPIDEPFRPWMDALVQSGRAATVQAATLQPEKLAFAAEHLGTIGVLYPNATIAPKLALPKHLTTPAPSLEDAVLRAVRGHAEVMGPFFPSDLAARLALDPTDVAVAIGQLESEGLVLRGRFSPRAAGPAETRDPDEDEVCDRRLLARIHRYTLDRLRSEIEPVSARDFLRYLFERHHVSARARSGGRAGLREAIGMLQGFEIAAASWEKDILGPRVAGYRPEWLDELCLDGDVAWARLSLRKSSAGTGSTGSGGSGPSRVTPIAITLRADRDWLLQAVRGTGADDATRSAADATNAANAANATAAPHEDAAMPDALPADDAAAILSALRRRGALFLEDVAKATQLERPALTAALLDLVGSGLVAGDAFQPLRELLGSGNAARRARQRSRALRGRWSLVERIDPESMLLDELGDRVAGQLLTRYGVVFRELTARESFTVPWRYIVRALRLREARGLVRGGRFVAGFIGEQYALPEALDALRRIRKQERNGDIVRIRASDPLNLMGVLLPGPRIPSHHGAYLVFRDGEFVSAEASASIDKQSPLTTMAPPIGG